MDKNNNSSYQGKNAELFGVVNIRDLGPFAYPYVVLCVVFFSVLGIIVFFAYCCPHQIMTFGPTNPPMKKRTEQSPGMNDGQPKLLEIEVLVPGFSESVQL